MRKYLCPPLAAIPLILAGCTLPIPPEDANVFAVDKEMQQKSRSAALKKAKPPVFLVCYNPYPRPSITNISNLFFSDDATDAIDIGYSQARKSAKKYGSSHVFIDKGEHRCDKIPNLQSDQIQTYEQWIGGN